MHIRTLIQALKMSGYDETCKYTVELFGEIEKVFVANKIDDEKDEDHDGIRDVKQIDNAALASRKLRLVFAEVDPVLVNKAATGLFQVFLSVAATLRLQFAQYITFGNALGAYLNKTATYLLYDLLVSSVAAEYDKW